MTTVLKSIAGRRVTVYEDPFTQQKLEGKAELVKLISRRPDFDRWLVDFHDGYGHVERILVHPFEFQD